jgi:hypothetical protein
LVVGAVYFWFYSPWDSTQLNILTALISVLGVRPTLQWLQRHDETYPLLEVLQLMVVPFYAVPLFTEHAAVVKYPEATLVRAAWVVLVFQVSCSVAGALLLRTHQPKRKKTWWHTELIAESKLRFTSYTMMITVAWLFVAAFTNWTPPELSGTFRAIFFGIGIISAFLQARLWGLGLLTQGRQAFFVFLLVLYVLLASLSLLLITSLTLLLLVLVGYFSAARRIPWMAIVIVLPIFFLLHGGKSEMRKIYWVDHARPITLADVPAFYSEWFGHGFASGGNISGDEETGAGVSLLERASLFQIVSYVVDTVPERTPYLAGSTYSIVPPQVIPRFLWPEKPSPNESVKILSVELGMLTSQQAETTSIGFGLIAESYANFGIYGAIILGFAAGYVLRKVSLITAGCATLSTGGIFRILCLAWCLNSEVTMAVWVSSLYQACVAVIGPLVMFRAFTKN